MAVKRLGRGSRQGAREFENEAMLLSRVQHKNVVNLYGYCAHDDDKLLVYEYIPNESLDKLLFSGKHSPPSSSSRTPRSNSTHYSTDDESHDNRMMSSRTVDPRWCMRATSVTR